MPVPQARNVTGFQTGPTGTPITGPLVVNQGAQPHWDDTCDVLVIGCGLAGASTALKAAENPSISIIVADRFDGGGASQASGGVLYLGGGTRVQQDAGIADSVEDMANYLSLETGNVVGRGTLEAFCRESASMIPWLEQHGARFGGVLTEDKTSYPQGDQFLYYSGNERLGSYAAVAKPAARGHRAKPWDGSEVNNGGDSGNDLMVPLKQAIDNTANITFKRQTSARRLVLNSEGAVLGAELWQIPPGVAARAHARLTALTANMVLSLLGLTSPLLKLLTGIERRAAKPRLVRATKGVVMAAGGFVYNRGMLSARAPVFDKVLPLGTIGDDGSGIMLGESVGGVTGNMDRVSPWRFLYPPASWSKGIVCSVNGERIVNEESYGAIVGEAVFEQSGGRAWLVIDQPLLETSRREAANPKLMPFQRYLLKGAFSRYIKTAATIEELAGAIGVPAAALARTVLAYNDDIAAGRPDAFGKAESLRKPLQAPPFSAVDISYYTRFFPMTGITIGGLQVDERSGAVLGANGVIPGLYAVGRSAVGLPSNRYVSGLSLADCVWSGWRTARALASVAE